MLTFSPRPALTVACLWGATAAAQTDLESLARLRATAGEERAAAEYVAARLGAGAAIDNTGSVRIAFGEGEPAMLLVAGLDEPGFLIGGITDDGFPRLQRLAEAASSYQFESYWPGWPVEVWRHGAAPLPGVMAAAAVHFSADRGTTARSMDALYVDVGAGSAADAAAAGVRLLDRVTLLGDPARLGADEVAGPWITSRAGAAALLAVADRLRMNPPKARVTLAFVGQQQLHNTGLLRALRAAPAGRTIVVRPGGESGLAVAGAAGGSEYAGELRAWAAERGVRLETGGAVRMSFGPFPPEDAWNGAGKAAILTLGPRFSGSPAETLEWAVLADAARVLAGAAGLPDDDGWRVRLMAARPAAAAAARAKPAEGMEGLLEKLLAPPGVSGAEGPIREAIRGLLPSGLRRAATVDERGNLIVALGGAGPPRALFIAHMDEIGLRVTRADAGNEASAEARGGVADEVFAFHPLTLWRDGQAWPAVMGRFGQVRAGVAMREGDTLTPAKGLTRLLGERVSGRGLDDRAGCAALIEALGRLRPTRGAAPVWFVFSVEEETGLHGAEALAARVSPRRVYAVDSLVTSDSPLEPKRIGHVRLGDGAALRAADSSGLTPRAEVERVLALARSRGIPLRAGATAGGNDGSKFPPAGAVNIPLAFPLRYSHTAAETADLRDLRALADLIVALAEDEMGER